MGLMRIAIVSRELTPLFGAGIGVYAGGTARALVDAGHEVHVITERPEGVDDERIGAVRRMYPGVRIHLAEPDGEGHHYRRRAYGVAHLVRSLHAGSPFDLIEVPDYYAEGLELVRGRAAAPRKGLLRKRSAAGALAGALLAARLHTPSRLCRELNEEREAPEETESLTRDEFEVLRGVDVLVSPSRALLERVTGDLGKDAPGGVVIPYPLDVDAVVREAEEGAGKVPLVDGAGADGIVDDRPEILCFGRLERRKGVHVLVEAAGLLAKEGLDFRVTLMGGDTMTGPGQTSMKTHLIRRIARHGLASRVRIRGARPRREVLALVRRATVCCFPALWDNFPNATLEAMALGMPVVATRAGGNGEVIEDEVSGVLAEGGDAASLAGALRRVSDDGGLRTQLSQNAPARVRMLCDPARVVRQVEELVRARA